MATAAADPELLRHRRVPPRAVPELSCSGPGWRWAFAVRKGSQGRSLGVLQRGMLWFRAVELGMGSSDAEGCGRASSWCSPSVPRPHSRELQGGKSLQEKEI